MEINVLLERDIISLKEELLTKNVEKSSRLLLPMLPAGFLIPGLPDRPQNPIMDTIKQARRELDGSSNLLLLPPELQLLTLDEGGGVSGKPQSRLPERPDIWREALTRNRGLKNRAFNWDGLRSPQYQAATTSKFISEQDPFVTSIARRQKIQSNTDTGDLVYASRHKLFTALKLTVLGTASVFHVWDENLEKFVTNGTEALLEARMSIDGMDKTISESVINRFIVIGTSLRRLEKFAGELRNSSPGNGAAVFAFAHALSTVTSMLKKNLAEGPPTPIAQLLPEPELVATWLHYDIYEQTLTALSRMCHREFEKSPDQYQQFEVAEVLLLDLIYSHLNKHLNSQTPRFLTAIFAYILVVVSDDYLRKLSHSIGYHTDAHHKHRTHTKSSVYLADDGYDVDGLDEEDNDDSDGSWEDFPEFLPSELLDILPVAQKSLTLLKAAQPDHPLLEHNTQRSRICWIWDELSIESAWMNKLPANRPLEGQGAADNGQAEMDRDQFALFRVFDLEPGQAGTESSSITDSKALEDLVSFIDTFPEQFPTIMPDLSHLTSLVMAPLVEHASTLAGALLSLFLTSSDNLNFRSHLILLRSYLLVTGPQFRSRLSSALLSDSEDTHSDETTQQMSIKYLKRKPRTSSTSQAEETSQVTWAMGLSPSLLERGEWPPVDADVRFFLRTVIVDSLDGERETLEAMGLSPQVIQEAESRLGFIPRLPSRDVKVKWQDPLAIEALDFVYMTYRPPRPLEVLITPDIVVKYQRLFSFIVRLMRVEHALGSLFRITRKQFAQLFPTLVEAQRQLLHFRFVAQSFISNLSRYVFDTAIGGNFDPFLEKFSAASGASGDRRHPGYTDVFSLANSHSAMLDDILSACMLRKAQHGILDVLRSLLQTILDFCVKVGMRYRGQLEEYQAAPMLAEISQKFHSRMTFFVRTLRKILDMDKDSSIPLSMMYHTHGDTRESVGGAEALKHLLLRLDLGKWWITSK